MNIIDTNGAQGKEPDGHFGGLTTTEVVGQGSAKHLSVQLSRGPVGSGAFMHLHEESEQLFFVIGGELTISTDLGESVVLRPGMAAYLAPGEAHATKNNGNEAVVSLVITSPQT